MDSLQDIRSVWNNIGSIAVNLQKTWPSDALVPSEGRELIAGIDALCTLYRRVYVHVPEQQWPDQNSTGSLAKVLKYFWGDFNLDRTSPEAISRAREAALEVLQSTLSRTPGQDTRAFEVLCRSHAMTDLFWKDEEFQFYQPICTREKGTEVWTQGEHFVTPEQRASLSVQTWDTSKEDTIQSFMDGRVMRPLVVKEDDIKEGAAFFNAPRIIQVNFTIGKWVSLSLEEIYKFTARAGKEYSYIFVAVVRLRNPAVGIHSDTIRTFNLEGMECLPQPSGSMHGRESWGGSIRSDLPEGQSFAVFYHRAIEGECPERPYEAVFPQPDSGWETKLDTALQLNAELSGEDEDESFLTTGALRSFGIEIQAVEGFVPPLPPSTAEDEGSKNNRENTGTNRPTPPDTYQEQAAGTAEEQPPPPSARQPPLAPRTSMAREDRPKTSRDQDPPRQ